MLLLDNFHVISWWQIQTKRDTMAHLHNMIKLSIKLVLRRADPELMEQDIKVSMRTSRGISIHMGLYRRKDESGPTEIASFLFR